jgi:DNA-binding beta-propeller fold protein YncE
VHEVNLNTGTRPVHIYRDPTDGEVIWSMNDGDSAGATEGDDLINCPAQTGGSVTILHNSHLGPGAHPPTVERTVCVLAKGHKVTAFSSGTGIPKRAFVSSETAGEIAVIDNEPTTSPRWPMIRRIDLCNPVKETCNDENPTGAGPFTPNNARPHGIRWSKATNKIYSLQEGYREIAEINPATLDIERKIDLAATPYTSFGITPDGRFLLLRGQTLSPPATKLAVVDITVNPPAVTEFPDSAFTDALVGTSPGAFKFSPDGRRFYILAGNAAAAPKKDRLFAFDSSTLTANPPTMTLLREIVLAATGGHSFDVLAMGAGEAQYIVVSNSTDNSVSIINATDNLIKQSVQVGLTPDAVLVYYAGAASAGNQATSSLTGGGSAATFPKLTERLDDHGMPE